MDINYILQFSNSASYLGTTYFGKRTFSFEMFPTQDISKNYKQNDAGREQEFLGAG